MRKAFGTNTRKENTANDYSGIRIGLVSPEKILSWSFGEVTKPETINYRTFKPEKDGLFCAKTFGPVTDWECLCGKFKRMKHRGVVCDKCGVEVTRSKVRRERMGHIKLAAPVSHVWFFKGLPSRIGHLLDLSLRDLERVLYFEAYIITDAGDTDLAHKKLLTEEEFREAKSEYGLEFQCGMGAEAIKVLLQQIDVEELSLELRHKMRTATSQQKKKKYTKRLKVVEAFRRSGNKPEWMIMDVIPVIPPELRPLVPLDGGRFATSDLNDLYRKVITRNNRLKKLLDLGAPEVIIRNEKRMLQEAVDALFDNGRRGRAFRGSNNRPLKSLADTLKGKQGRFRQNLLGKRVDYSGRSVIVVGPELKLHQCGLPKKMALELFKPFIYNKLEKAGYAATIKAAKELVDKKGPKVWDFLDEVIQGHPVMLNRAPTLHRLGIQAFEPVLVEGKAIRIHPLVCSAFNADFDGDQMAVHVPLTSKSQLEARYLMLATNNVLSPSNGKAVAVPSQDMVLGLYYLTSSKSGTKGEGRIFSSFNEVMMAYENLEVETLTPIRVQYSGELIDLTTVDDNQDVMHVDIQIVERQAISTTVGRVIFNDRIPAEVPFVNGLLKKKGLSNLVNFCHLRYGNDLAVRMLDDLKDMGFYYATKAGISIGINDMIIPDSKTRLIEEAERQVSVVEAQHDDGHITNGERYNKTIDIWTIVTETVTQEMFESMSKPHPEVGDLNPIFVMADSGARGSKEQIRQLAGMRGLMAKPSGEIIETPITANFREGLNGLQYFISTHGARKGLADTALKTANSGYLTRRLVDVVQDSVISEIDCQTMDGIYVTAITEGSDIIQPLRERIVGRVALDDIVDPITGEIIVEANTEIDDDLANQVQEAGIEKVKIRSVLTCESRKSVCAKCYGKNLSTGKLVEIGEAVGIIAAQSIGEPGTQLTMRTFHIGGTASKVVEESTVKAKNSGFVEFRNLNTVENKDGFLVAMKRNGSILVKDRKGREKEVYNVVQGATIKVKDGDEVNKGDDLLEWDPFSKSIITEFSGTVVFKDLIEEVTIEEEVDVRTGHSRWIVMETPDVHREPLIMICDDNGNELKNYPMPSLAHIMVANGEKVSAGDTLSKIPRETSKTKDITGGLPRVEELFEARPPKEPAIISEIDGVVKYGEMKRTGRIVYVEGVEGDRKKYTVARGVHISVQDGEKVKAGEKLIDGPVNPHDMLGVLGERELQDYLVREVQEVYRVQGVDISDKHIEIVVRQMMRWVLVEEVGDTDFLIGEKLDKFKFMDENKKVISEGGEPALGRPLLLGITKASLNTDSFISAASFQETTRVLTEAAIEGKVDNLSGLKENVIMGRLIPAGTGIAEYRKRIFNEPDEDEEQEEEMETIDEITPDNEDISMEEEK